MPLFFWIAAYVRPYRSRLAFLALLSVLEVGLAALAPWPIKIVVDQVLSHQPRPRWLDLVTTPIGGETTVGLLTIVLVAGLYRRMRERFCAS